MPQSLEQFILANFESALERGQIQPWYQPVIRTISRRLCSFEALARWVDPERGTIQPDEFIPILEKNRTIHLLDASIIRQVCARIRRTMAVGGTPIPVSVNLSKMDFTLCDIFRVVDDIATEYQIPHDFLYIEITESIMSEKEDLMRGIVDRFRAAGYQVWMDDFGSAYSSLNVLKDYEFNELKLDMRFLSTFNQRSRQITAAVVQMAKTIDIHTLAEGVETEEQFRYLRNIGCEKVQGFYFGKPMPYREALLSLEQAGIEIEKPQDRKYYDDIGRIDLLSAVPFMTREQRNALTTARELNSIPLAIAEARQDSFSILFCNTAFEKTAQSAGIIAGLFSQELLGVPQPYSLLPARVAELLDSTGLGETGHMLFTSNEEYYEFQTKCIARRQDAYSVLFCLRNLSEASEAARTNQLDDSLRQLYTLFERITLLDANADAITPLYMATREDLLSGREDIRALTREYAERWVFPDDRQAYIDFMDLPSLEARLLAGGMTYVSGYFRALQLHGQYAWRHYTLLRLREGVYLSLIRNVHAELVAFSEARKAEPPREETFSPASLWENLVRSDIVRLFWKDRDRRFVGASRAFLDYYEFNSVGDIRGRNDEDLGWHIRPDHYMNDEMRVIHEGVSLHNIPGRCMNQGENREILASKAPIYDRNGEIQGLIGCFIDKELLSVNDTRGKETKRRDYLTGLLNTRGIAEEARAFQDEYYLRNMDFVRMHLEIDDFASINSQYGFDFGDRAIATLGQALKAAFGRTCAVGRFKGHQFVILHQVEKPAEAAALRAKVKRVAAGIQQIDGVALTFYLSVGYALYSEFMDLDEQGQNADVRLLADHDEHASAENRLSRSSEIFHLYDDLPIAYAVYRVRVDDGTGMLDAKLFYVNHLFEQRSGMKASELLGRSCRELFPGLGEDWYEKASRAALLGETIVDRQYYAPTGKQYYMTASQIIHAGYCSFTYQEIDRMSDER